MNFKDFSKTIDDGIKLWQELGQTDTKGELMEELGEFKEIAQGLAEKFPIVNQVLGILHPKKGRDD